MCNRKIEFDLALMSCSQDTMTVQIYLKPYAYGLDFDRHILATKEKKTSMLASILADEPDIETIILSYPLITPRALHCIKAFLEGGHKPVTTDPVLEKAGDYLGIPLMRGWLKDPTVVRVRLPNYGYSRLVGGRIPHQTLPFLQDNYEGMTPTQVDILARIWENNDVFPGPHEPSLHSDIFGEYSILPFMGTPHFDLFRERFPEVNLFKAETFAAPQTYGKILIWALEEKMPQQMQLRFIQYIISDIGYCHFHSDDDYTRQTKRDDLLVMAAEKGLADIVKVILPGAKIQPIALTRACKAGHVDVVKVLLADRTCNPSYNQNEALKAAKRNQHRAIVRLLKAHPKFIH